MSKRQLPGLPSRDQILQFIQSSDQPAGKREIARAFALSGQEKIALKALLKDMADEGLIDASPGRAFHKAGGVPKVTVLQVVDADDGQVWAVPENWEPEAGPAPRLRVVERGRRTALGPGDRILARTEAAGQGHVAHPMKTLARGEALVLGVLHDEGGGLWLKPVDKRERRDWPVSDAGGAAKGDLVLAEKTGRPPRITVRVAERLGDPFQPRSFSLIAIHKHGIPSAMPAEVTQEAERMAVLPLGEREDLTHLPIVAIDPADARDHDDAVWAAPDDDPANPGGFRAIVAIADVAFYVRPGSTLDREAKRRGNSVYFPDRVVPMLPERLSADVCSLKEGEDRAALVCHLVIGANGALKSWRFTRARVRLAANIAYEDAQAAIDWASSRQPTRGSHGEGNALAARDPSFRWDDALVDTALRPLWACWAALKTARDAREPLELDLPERRVELDEQGRIAAIAPRERLDAHRLVEDFMIAANVAAAKALESRKAPVMYRDHEPPGREKLVALKDYLKTFGVEFALGQVIRPRTFNQLLGRLKQTEGLEQASEQVLRTQTQAYYAPANTGHFGLALGSYAHFTSPIRRYADLLVHRSLVGAFGLGPDVEATRLTGGEAEGMARIGEAISAAERRAMEAERETIDRYVAAYLSAHVGEVMETRITGVRAFGFFATVAAIGGDGLVPVSTLGREYFRYDEAAQVLVGEESGTRFSIGQVLPLRLAEANPISASLRFELPESDGTPARRPPPRRKSPIRRAGRRPG